jgi:hypothetical protein
VCTGRDGVMNTTQKQPQSTCTCLVQSCSTLHRNLAEWMEAVKVKGSRSREHNHTSQCRHLRLFFGPYIRSLLRNHSSQFYIYAWYRGRMRNYQLTAFIVLDRYVLYGGNKREAGVSSGRRRQILDSNGFRFSTTLWTALFRCVFGSTDTYEVWKKWWV